MVRVPLLVNEVHGFSSKPYIACLLYTSGNNHKEEQYGENEVWQRRCIQPWHFMRFLMKIHHCLPPFLSCLLYTSDADFLAGIGALVFFYGIGQTVIGSLPAIKDWWKMCIRDRQPAEPPNRVQSAPHYL